MIINMAEKIPCPVCGKMIKATSVYCGYCGAKIVMVDTPAAPPAPDGPMIKVCTVCGAEMNMRANFCGKCGGELIVVDKNDMRSADFGGSYAPPHPTMGAIGGGTGSGSALMGENAFREMTDDDLL